MKKTTRLLILNSMICLGLWGSSTYTSTAWSTVASPATEPVVQPVHLTYTPAEVSRQIQKVDVPASDLPLTPGKALRHLAPCWETAKNTINTDACNRPPVDRTAIPRKKGILRDVFFPASTRSVAQQLNFYRIVPQRFSNRHPCPVREFHPSVFRRTVGNPHDNGQSRFQICHANEVIFILIIPTIRRSNRTCDIVPVQDLEFVWVLTITSERVDDIFRSLP
ncbi:hypothetical protein C7459_11989 [Tumebacillus permanentifrigoris]|uniref:Uncharacterized protein n=1 Tax=Tumebacillus permanentifrigoris TaxID=378543 RepID=A0A316DR64_9BACL|nr:hypothetical protein C7459_11989 [Tumebacillus permanentifrigoris]